MARFRRSPAALLAVSACLVLAGGLVVQTVVLARTVFGGVHQQHRVDWVFLKRAARTLPLNAVYASNAYGSGYVLYPRTRVAPNLDATPSKLRATLARRRIRYLVLLRPTPGSLAHSSSWTRSLYHGPDGDVLEVR